MKIFKGKKGVVDQLQPAVLGLVTVGLVLAIGFLILAEGKDQIDSMGEACVNSSLVYNSSINICCSTINCTAPGVYNTSRTGAPSFAINGTNDTISAMAGIPGWLPIIVIVVIGVLLLALVRKFR